MPRGNWDTYNKVLPGIYVRYRGIPSNPVNSGVRGTVTLARELNWGDTTENIIITDTANTITQLGYDINSDELRFVREIFAGSLENSNAQVTTDGSQTTDGANTILLRRLNGTGGVAASITENGLTITGKYAGTRGNDITVTITADPDSEYEDGEFAVMIVRTIVDGLIRDTQRVGRYNSNSDYEVATIGDLSNNNWVNFTGTATVVLQATAGVTLTGGVNPTITANSHAEYLDSLSASQFNVIVYDGTDNTIKEAYYEFVTSILATTGYMVRLVTSNFNKDDELLINVVVGYYIGDDQYPMNEATWWIAGLDAGCPLNVSITNVAHPRATRVDTPMSDVQLEANLLEGNFVLYNDFNQVRILADINTATTFDSDRTEIYKYNHVERVLADMIRTFKADFSTDVIGRYKNTPETRALFKGQIIERLNQYLSIGAIDAFNPDEQIVEQVVTQPESVHLIVVVYIGNFILKIYTDFKVA